MKKILTLLLTGMMFMCFVPVSLASNAMLSEAERTFLTDSKYKIQAEIFNEKTGAKQVLPIKEWTEVSTQKIGDRVIATYEVVAGYSKGDQLIKPLTVSEGSQTEGGVKATIALDYTMTAKSGGQYNFKLNKVSGGWKITDKFTVVDNRSVLYGIGYGQYNAKQTPNSNTFTYSPSWPTILMYPNTEVSGQRAESKARYYIPGMTSYYWVTVSATAKW